MLTVIIIAYILQPGRLLRYYRVAHHVYHDIRKRNGQHLPAHRRKAKILGLMSMWWPEVRYARALAIRCGAIRSW